MSSDEVDRSSFAPSMDRMAKSLSGLMSTTYSGGRPSGPNVPMPMSAQMGRSFGAKQRPTLGTTSFGGFTTDPVRSGGRPGWGDRMQSWAVGFRGNQQTYTPPDMFGGSGPGSYSATLNGTGSTQYDAFFEQAAREVSQKYGVNLPASLLKAMGHIESGGTFDNSLTRDDGFGDGLSVGIMQVKPELWGTIAGPQYNAYDPLGNIMIGATLMAQSMAQGRTWQQAVTEVYFPVNDPNGTSQDDYIRMATEYMNMYGGMGSTTPFGPTKGQFTGNISGGGSLGSIWGSGVSTPVTFGFGAHGGRDLYKYGAAGGLDGSQHTGLDIGVPYGTPLYAPMSGTVSCVGSADAGIGGTGGGGCGYYDDTDGGGIGNITIKLDNGAFLVLGHSSSASVQPGQRVNAGQLVGKSGGMYGNHTHVEVQVPDSSMPSGYRLVDPVAFFGGGVPTTGSGSGGTSPGMGYTPAPSMRMWGGRPIVGAAAYR